MTVYDVINSHNSVYPDDKWDLNSLTTNQELELRISCCKHKTDDGYGDKSSFENFLNGIDVKKTCDSIELYARLDEQYFVDKYTELLKLTIQGYKFLLRCNT